MPKRYPAEFRRKVSWSGCRPVAQVAADLAISEQTPYVWRRQHLIELVAARRRIGELVAGRDPSPGGAAARWCPERRFEAIAVLASHKLPVQLVCRVLGVSESGYYDCHGAAGGTRSRRSTAPS